MSSKNTARIARDAFAANAIDLLQRALANGLGARITVDPNGVDTHADLFDGDGVVHLTHQLHATQLALPLAPQAPAPSQPPAAVEAPADAAHPLAVGDRIILDGVAVEVLGVDRGGFIWRTTDGGDFEEGDVEWSAVQHVAGDVWAPRRIDDAPVAARAEEPPPVEAPKPAAAKKPRAKKAPAKTVEAAPAAGVWQLIERLRDGSTEHNEWEREDSARAFFAHSRKRPEVAYAQLADPSGAMVDEYTAPPGAQPALWRLVEHIIGAPPVETREGEHVARAQFKALAALNSTTARRVELFDDVGLLVDSHNYGSPSSPTPRGLDGVPASVPEYLRDLAALTVAEWWCVVVQQAVRPDLTEVKLCTDEGTAVATAERARLEDDSANSATRIVVFTATGEVHDAWHRWSPAQSTVVEAHPEADLFRVAVALPDAFADVAPWVNSHGLAWYASGHQRNTPAEVREGDFWLLWGKQNSDAVAIVPRALVVLVERRAAGWKLDLRIEPWTASTERSALRVGSRVDLRGEEWRVFLLPDHETATLTRGDDELADVALAEVHPSGTGGWWAERAKPKAAKATKAPKRAKAVA